MIYSVFEVAFRWDESDYKITKKNIYFNPFFVFGKIDWG